MVGAGLLDLEDLRAQVAHGDSAVYRVGAVHGVFEHHVRVSGFELQFGEGHEEFARVDVGLANAVVVHHGLVVFADGDVCERFAHDAFDVVWAEQGHAFVTFRQFEGDVGDHHAERERFDADLLIGVFAFGVEEPHDVRMVGAEVYRARALSGAQLVGVTEGVFQKFHHGDDAAGLVFDAFDGRAGLT